VGAPDDVMVRGARILPESLDDGRVWGAAPGGGERAIVGGERVVSWPDGAMAATVDRLPADPSAAVEVPERMGGGFLFAMGPRLWRADAWLARAEPLFTMPSAIVQVQAGLDRMYVRTVGGGLLAVDPRKGTLVGLGPLPATPTLGRMAAIDAWRAVAIADLRGALLTLDAGSTWRPLPLPIDPVDVMLTGDGLAVVGNDEMHQAQWWEVRPDGQVGRLGAPPVDSGKVDRPSPPDPSTGTFGHRPLVTAVADGWPLVDGTALVARDGTLGRVRLSDGALVETLPAAFPLKPARCHPLSLARPREPGAFGFVCGEPHGATVIYRYAPAEGRLVEARRFDGPREVLGFTNGALAARGPCAADAVDDVPAGEVAFCVMPPGGAWSDLHFRGEDVDRARLVVLHDGRVALVRPPRGEDLSTLRVTLTDGVRSTHVPVQMPSLRSAEARALRVGVWMDGFEERRDGVLGGWVEGGGSVVGVEIALDGQARVGSLRVAGDVFVSGRWGLGWTASRRGIETVDGGMTWKDVDVPEPSGSAHTPRERACGPIGCLAAGWMRIGWGDPEKVPVKDPPVRRYAPARAARALELDCVDRSGRLPDHPTHSTSPRRGAALPVPGLQPGAGMWGTLGLMGSAQSGSVDLPPFLARPAPPMGSDDSGFTLEVPGSLSERSLRNVPLARVYAWGPKSGDWDQLGRWSVSWLWPFGGWPDARGTGPAAAPWTSIEAARRALQLNAGGANAWMLAPGDDPDHALLVVRTVTSVAAAADVLVLETDRAPVEVRRAGGESFPDVEAAERVGGRWYVATAQPAGGLSATVVWLVDGSVAREVARVPRAIADARPPLRLARRTDGRALGLVVDGVLDPERGTMTRWIMSIDLESGAIGEPEPLAPADFSDRAVTPCTGDDSGWEIDLPYSGAVVLNATARWRAALQSPLARMRVSRDRACFERLSGTAEGYAPLLVGGRSTGPGAPFPQDRRAIDVGLVSARMRYSLRCSLR
jgi:hypothetical protein